MKSANICIGRPVLLTSLDGKQEVKVLTYPFTLETFEIILVLTFNISRSRWTEFFNYICCLLSFCEVRFRSQTHVIRIVGKCLHLLNHLTNSEKPHKIIVCIIKDSHMGAMSSGSAIKNVYCSSKGSELSSQHLHTSGSSHLPVTLSHTLSPHICMYT